MMIFVDVTKVVTAIVIASWNAAEIVIVIFAASLCFIVIRQVSSVFWSTF